jgi:hypothetical protein
MLLRPMIATVGCSLAAGCAAPLRSAAVEASPCASAPRTDTSDWRRVDAVAFVFRLPADFEQQEVEGIDSALRRWVSPDGREVQTDYGFYNRRFAAGLAGSGEELITVCQEGDGEAAPQIVPYRTRDGRYAAGLYWPNPGGGRKPFGAAGTLREALWMSAQSPRREDLPEMLAIVSSVEYK